MTVSRSTVKPYRQFCVESVDDSFSDSDDDLIFQCKGIAGRTKKGFKICLNVLHELMRRCLVRTRFDS